MKKILLFLCLALAGTSCTKDFFVYDDIESRVYFLKSGIVSLKLNSKSCEAVVVKGGYTKDSPVVSVDVDQAVIQSYNEKYGTDYKMLPPSTYSFEGGEKVVDRDSNVTRYVIDLDLEDLDSGAWMLPVRLTSNDVAVNNDKDVLMFTIEIK